MGQIFSFHRNLVKQTLHFENRRFSFLNNCVDSTSFMITFKVCLQLIYSMKKIRSINWLLRSFCDILKYYYIIFSAGDDGME